jgi:hypothetical protein
VLIRYFSSADKFTELTEHVIAAENKFLLLTMSKKGTQPFQAYEWLAVGRDSGCQTAKISTESR